MCKYIIAVAVQQNKAEFPEMANPARNPVLLGSKRKAGRIPHAKRALQNQQ